MMKEAPTLEGAEPAARPAAWKIWLKTGRPMTLTATVSPLAVGTAFAGYEGTFQPLLFLMTFFSCLFLQIGTNYFNEYFDHRYGLDHEGSLGAMTVIFRNEMTPGQVLGGGIICFACAAALGIALTVLLGPEILLFGLAGMLIAYFYSARPFKLASRGLGDIMVFLAMGVLMTWGAYYVQLQRWSWMVFLASIPVGLLVASILNMNNVRDYQDDLAVNKKTLPVRFGLRFGQFYHGALLIGSYIITTVFALIGLFPLASLAVWLTFPFAFVITRDVITATERKAFIIAMKRTSLHYLAFGVVFALAIVVATLVGRR
jgi:1,4-dihydroxy-2-naphthoate octaprenyltransferase